MTSNRTAPSIVLSANTSWYLYNFRGGLARALTSAGYRVLALSPRDEFSGRLAEFGCEWLELPMKQRGLGPMTNLATGRRYAQVYARERPKAALHFTIKPVIFGSLAARLLRIPTINTITGMGNTFLRDDLVTRVVTMLYRPALGASRSVFFQNGDDRDLFLARDLVRTGQVRMVAGSGVDVDRFAPPQAQPSGVFTFLFIGRLLTEKGVLELIEAARMVRMTHNFRIVLLGPMADAGPAAVADDQLKGWVAEGLVEYAGSAEDVRPFITQADCVVLPSYREGTPRTLLEAAAMGRPAVATDVPGCREVVIPGETGLLCRPRDSGDLARALVEMMDLDPGERARMGSNARRRAETVFDERQVVANYLHAIEAAIEGRREDAALGPVQETR